MRINHAGEICAQALYRGQMLVAKEPQTYAMLNQACTEELDHLAWTQQRLTELASYHSYLNILWYANSYSIGVLAGLAGNPWSLGFIEETENQVTVHLEKHLQKLAPFDKKSHAIIDQMRIDEMHHSQKAHNAGAKELPFIIKKIMTAQSKVMTTIAYWF